MAGRHVRPLDPNVPPIPPPGVDRRVILGAALVVLAALVAVLVIKFHVFGGGDSVAAGSPPPRATATKTPSVTNGSPSTTATKPVTSPTATTTPTVKPSPSAKPTAKPTTKPTTKPTPTKTVQPPPPPPPAPRYPLLVLNNSTVTGLGTAAANDFEAGGWTISGVGNLTGRLRDTTVYFAPGYEASAQAFARQFPQVYRVLARIHGLPGTSKLTVVVTRYYEPGGGK